MVDNNTQFFKTQPEKTISVEGILEQVYKQIETVKIQADN